MPKKTTTDATKILADKGPSIFDRPYIYPFQGDLRFWHGLHRPRA